MYVGALLSPVKQLNFPQPKSSNVMKRSFTFMVLVALTGCIAGGVFIHHEKPKMHFDLSTEFVLELLVNAGNASKTYQHAVMVYRTEDDSFSRLEMVVDNADREHVVFKATTLPVPSSNEEVRFEYYFEYMSSRGDVCFFPDDREPLTINIRKEKKGSPIRGSGQTQNTPPFR